MAYETTQVEVSKSQDGVRKLIYSHKGTGLMLLSQPPREGFEAMVELDKQPITSGSWLPAGLLSRIATVGL